MNYVNIFFPLNKFQQLKSKRFLGKSINIIDEFLLFRDRARIIKELFNAQQATVDEIINEQVEIDEILNVSNYRYQIVNSCLSSVGDYQIDYRMY